MHVIIYAHPGTESFNHAVLERAIAVFQQRNEPYVIVDLYKLNYNPVLSLEEMNGQSTEDTKLYQALIKNANSILFIFPVWWFRAPAILEGFIDKVFVPGFGYRFKKISGTYGYPKPLLHDKKVLAIITHGAPALPVRTIYINAVKYRFLLGFLSFCFNIFKCRIVQLWSVPFISEAKRENYLRKVERKLQAL